MSYIGWRRKIYRELATIRRTSSTSVYRPSDMCTSNHRKLAMLSRNHTMKITAQILFVVLFAMRVIVPVTAYAQVNISLSETPAVIDEKAKQRDILNESVTITNTSSQPVTIYPSVYDVNVVNGEEIFSYARDASDLAASLANWMELSRGVIDLK